MTLVRTDEPRAAADEPAPTLRRVVLIDDSEFDADLLQIHLRMHYPGLEGVLWISQAAGLMEQIADFAPDLVITDHHMANYDVVSTISALRQRWPALPILVMSGLVGDEAALHVLRAGANDFLTKSRRDRLPLLIDRELADARSRNARARLQAELENQVRVNQAIFDQAPVGMWIVGRNGLIARANPHAEGMVGNGPASQTNVALRFQGWWADTGRPIDAAQWQRPTTFATREPRMARIVTDGGTVRHFNLSSAPLEAADGSSLGTVVCATDVTEQAALQDRLRRAEEHLRRLSVNQYALHEQQMANVSRELHDNLGQVLSLLKLHLGSAAGPETSPERRDLELAEALPLVDLALVRLREVCGDLWISELADFGLGPALDSLGQAAARASGFAVTVTETGEPGALDSVHQLGLFRVAQQALTNALRHSGGNSVLVGLNWAHGAAELSVTDDGRGFDIDAERGPSHQGLRGMRERMEMLGGALKVTSTAGSGTTVQAVVAASASSRGTP